MDKHRDEQLHDSFYLRQNELAQKNITLQVLHDHLKVNKELCEERKTLLRKETTILDEIHFKVWEFQNKICNQVWDFSMKHDLNEVVCNYPNLPSELKVFCECEQGSDTTHEENIQIEKLTLEIRSLESNLNSTTCESLEKELISAEKELHMREKECPENESLKTEIKTCEERILSLRSKIGAEHKRLESSTNISFEFSKNSNNSLKTNPSNVKRINAFVKKAPLLSVPQTNVDAMKGNCSLSKSSIPDGGGFVRASTYLNTIANTMPSQKIESCKQVATEAIPTDKLSAFTDLPRKKFVAKTKSGITQRR